MGKSDANSFQANISIRRVGDKRTVMKEILAVES